MIVFFEFCFISYKAKVFSLSSLFCFGSLVVIFLIPFFLAFSSSSNSFNLGFWSDVSSLYVSPNVEFNGNYILQIMTDEEILYYSSVKRLGVVNPSLIEAPSFRVS